MKKILALLLLLYVSSLALYAQEGKPEIRPPRYEIGVNIFGIPLGFFQAQMEFALADGLIGLGPRVSVIYTDIYGLFPEPIFEFTVQGECRLYFQKSTEKTYVYTSVGYDYLHLYSLPALHSIPLYTGIGYKQVLGNFSIDAGIGLGRVFTIGKVSTEDEFLEFLLGLLNNLYAFGGNYHLAVGYRF